MRIRLFWYRITQWFSKLFLGRRNHPVPVIKELSDIPASLDWGRDWKADPRGSDIFYHPRRVQKRIDQGKPGIGDCEDHAGWWIACLFKANMASNAALGVVIFEVNGKKSGHAVCVFTDVYGKKWWGDYSMPNPVFGTTWWAFGLDVARRFKANKIIAVELYPAVRIRNDDTVVFHVRGVRRQKLNLLLH